MPSIAPRIGKVISTPMIQALEGPLEEGPLPVLQRGAGDFTTKKCEFSPWKGGFGSKVMVI